VILKKRADVKVINGLMEGRALPSRGAVKRIRWQPERRLGPKGDWKTEGTLKPKRSRGQSWIASPRAVKMEKRGGAPKGWNILDRAIKCRGTL